MPKVIDVTAEQTAETFIKNRFNMRATSRELGVSRGTVKSRLIEAEDMGFNFDKPVSGGKLKEDPVVVRPLPPKGELKRYIITSAQNNTDANVPFFTNLMTYADYLDAEILVGTFAYNRNAYVRGVKRDKGPTADDRMADWYDPILTPYLTDERVELAPMLHWCGHINISPTATRPLSSLEAYTGLASAIFPHTKFAMQSVAGTKDDGAKFGYTTGAVTMLNYVEKKAGFKASFHHTFGALIVEVDHDGDWFVRQLNASTDGSFYDIDDNGAIYIHDGEIEDAEVEAINWGDFHVRVIDEEIYSLAFGENGIMDTLRPRTQLVHDILDFKSRNHHESKNIRRKYEKWKRGEECVRAEIKEVVECLEDIKRDDCLTVVVDSNHDNALTRWIDDADWKHDAVNAEFYLEASLDWIRNGANNNDYHVLREACHREGLDKEIIFLGADESFVICGDEHGGIECGMHGHLGPNGARGAPLGLSKIGRRSNTGHTHSAQIIDGLYVAGTMTKLRLDYNTGPSSWSHSIIVTYPNGKRTIVTCFNGKWRGST